MCKKKVLTEPVEGFRTRITKKPFSIFITPETSPVQPERFRGFHTGADAEFEDVKDTVPVVAIADGVVELSGTAGGYGGIVAIRHEIGGKKYLGIYGHLKPSSLVPKGRKVSQAEQIGVLGEGFSRETDGARKHLHFGLYTGSNVNVRGYVGRQEELNDWVDPLALLNY